MDTKLEPGAQNASMDQKIVHDEDSPLLPPQDCDVSDELLGGQTHAQVVNGLLLALVLNILSTISSFLGFAVSGSMSLLADGVHMYS